MATANVIGEHTKDILTQIGSLTLLLANGLAPLFGVQVEGSTVPVEDVKSVETK